MSDSENSYSSEDETVSKDHQKLLQAIGSLSKVQHIKKAARKEPSIAQNEFDLVKPRIKLPKQHNRTSANTVDVQDLVKTLKTTSTHFNVGKELKNVQNTGKVLPKPLEKPKAEQLVRSINYDKTKKQLERWDPVVTQFQAAETLTFPLDSDTVYINTAKLKRPPPLSLKSEIQVALEEAEERIRALKGITKYVPTKDDEKLEQMQITKEEIKKRRQELLYLKIREQQRSAKLRKQNKIKSKKYHKLLKQQKLKEQLKEFELLQKQDPDKALEKLHHLEKNRVLERANLRHKNTGTWAKNNLVKAKYNRDVQKDLSEQLALSRQLTEKKDVSDDDDDEKSDEDMATVPKDPFNPWMQVNREKKEVIEGGPTGSGYRKYWLKRKEIETKIEEYRADLAKDSGVEADDSETPNKKTIQPTVVAPKTGKKKEKKMKVKINANQNTPTPLMENGWIVEDLHEVDTEANINAINNIFDKAEDSIFNRLKKKELKTKKLLERTTKALNRKNNRKRKEKNQLKNLQDLSFKTKPRIDIDEELLETSKGEEPVLPTPSTTTSTTPLAKKANNQSSDLIKHDNYANVKPKQLKTMISEVVIDGDGLDMDEDEENVTIERQAAINDAFEDDDIVADFENKKTAEEKKALADQLTLSMPGWGSWAGTGISQDNQRAKKLVLDFKTKTESKNGNQNRVRINETANKKLREHLVSDLPFPFTSVKDYEASIRAPIGRSFVPETAFRVLTKPAIVVRKGHIIKPMDESELLKPAKRPRSVVEKRIMYDARVAAQ